MNHIRECPICLSSPLATPVYQCHNGHVICCMCESRSQSCPTCRERLPKRLKIRNLVVEQAQSHHVSCKNRGCIRQFGSEKDVAEHEKECEYRLLISFCRVMKIDDHCSERFACVDVEGITLHLALKHSENTTLIGNHLGSIRLNDYCVPCFFYHRVPVLPILIIVEVEKKLNNRFYTNVVIVGKTSDLPILELRFTLRYEQAHPEQCSMRAFYKSKIVAEVNNSIRLYVNPRGITYLEGVEVIVL